MSGHGDDDDMFPADLPSVPRMRKNAALSTKAAHRNVGLKRKVRCHSPRSDGDGDDIPRPERKKRFAAAPSSQDRPSLKEPCSARNARGGSDGSDVDAEKEASGEKPNSRSRGRLYRRAGKRKNLNLKRGADSNSDERAEEAASPGADSEEEGSSSEEVVQSSGKQRAENRRKASFKGRLSRPSSSVGAGSRGDENDNGSQGLGKEDDEEIGEQLASMYGSSDSDSNDAIAGSGRGQKLEPLSLDGEEKALDDYSEDESLGSEEEGAGKPGDSSQRLTVRQRAMQGEDLGTQLTRLASPKHKKKRKPPPEDLTKDEEKAIKLQQKARLRHMVHEKRNKEKRAAMVDKVLRGVTSKRKKLSLAAETYVAEAGARLAKDSVRDDCFRYTSKKEGSYVSIPGAMDAPRLLDVPRRVTAYPPKCERDPKTGKRVLS